MEPSLSNIGRPSSASIVSVSNESSLPWAIERLIASFTAIRVSQVENFARAFKLREVLEGPHVGLLHNVFAFVMCGKYAANGAIDPLVYLRIKTSNKSTSPCSNSANNLLIGMRSPGLGATLYLLVTCSS